MRIYDVNKLLSSENKSKIIAHFWTCRCAKNNITDLSYKMHIAQSNLSKHISVLLKLNVLKFKQVHKERFYSINPLWKKQWYKIINPQINVKENIKYKCTCSKS